MTHQVRRSTKHLRSLIDYIKPYETEFDEPVYGSVNGKPFAFPPRQIIQLTYAEFETLFFAGKIKIEDERL
jgi:hypothetical protein